MPDNLAESERMLASTTPKAPSMFTKRREEIYHKLNESATKCAQLYSGRKELATEKDVVVAELCEALENAFSYGLRQQQSVVALTAASLFQNMQEIVTGNIGTGDDTSFWDFCQIHLTPYERERYEQLRQVWTKAGRARAFIRAALNENSLQRYLLTWLSDEEQLRRFYTHWSLLLDVAISQELPQIVGKLEKILFALTVDSTELNAAIGSRTIVSNIIKKEEPIIDAPSPVPVACAKAKRKTNAVERPIISANSTEDLLKTLQAACAIVDPLKTQHYQNVTAAIEFAAEQKTEPNSTRQPPDAIEPYLEFLKHPLPDFRAEDHNVLHVANGNAPDTATTTIDAITSNGCDMHENESDKSDCSSQFSKSSNSVNCTVNHTAMEEQLKEMSERCAFLETRVAQLGLENRQLLRRLTKHFNESGIDPSASLSTHFLISIPQVKLLKTQRGGSSYYAYEVHITMRRQLEHWSVIRRYREFHKLHKSLLRTHPCVATVDFPPKKRFGNMNVVFVEERRQQLQIYLLNLVETLPQLEACKSKVELQKVFPFLR